MEREAWARIHMGARRPNEAEVPSPILAILKSSFQTEFRDEIPSNGGMMSQLEILCIVITTFK